jgi:hypothetical protein
LATFRKSSHRIEGTVSVARFDLLAANGQSEQTKLSFVCCHLSKNWAQT